MPQPLKIGDSFDVYRVDINEQDENCVIGKWYLRFSTYNDCEVLVNFDEHTQVYMYDDEITKVGRLQITKLKKNEN